MSPSALRTAAVSCALGAIVLLTGAPAFPALERAVSQVFVGTAVPAATDRTDGAGLLNVPDTPQRPGVAAPRPTPASSPARASGSELLAPLYASFLTLQALDVHSTLRAIDRGAIEGNPVMAPFTEHPAAFVAIKAGTAAGILYMTERVRRHSPLAAIIMMGAFNSVYATVVARNYQIGSQLPR